MVLTQLVTPGPTERGLEQCFHTTMVLTQQLLEKKKGKPAQTRFHTTMVLTQQKEYSRPIHEYVCFHTTMVLTQRDVIYSGIWQLLVSIPLWFLRNPGARPQAPPAADHVSIPLWFLRNHLPWYITKHINPVSIPLWFLRNLEKTLKSGTTFSSFHTTMVLTQRYQTRPGRPDCIRLFPYHYGSYATLTKTRMKSQSPCSFHTTMVLTQRERWKRQTERHS